ncbi:AAA family ATPase [Bariatricus sp. SGI.019]|uniref:AAA family ATPase n=1 Tax=Bariatricus sp. SGI.019 TaxID=3420548 RepID=UPI003D05B912
MAFQKPQINTIKPDIKNLSIYLRSTKKFGKTTLFRDAILAKYGDPSRGLLVGCGNEIGYKILDNLNTTQVTTYKDLIELRDWLINEKGKEHNIEIVAFDTGDELALIADKETIRLSNIENPNKKIKSIKAAFGGYTAGEKYSANDIIKPYMTSLQNAGFGVWVIAHTKFKTIKEKGGLEEDGYMQLTSNMGADYEAAFGDIFDVTLTGVIDRDVEEKGEGDKKKRYATDTVRKLYFRETPLIDAGGRFAYGAVPEYMIFDKEDMGAEFIRVIEEGMEKSKKTLGKKSPTPKVEKKPEPVKEDINDDIEDEIDNIDPVDESPVAETSNYPDDLIGTIRTMFKDCEDKDLKAEVKELIAKHGKLNDCDEDALKEIYDKLK